MKAVLDLVARLPQCRDVLAEVARGAPVQTVVGPSRGAATLVAAALFRQLGRSCLYVVPDQLAVERVRDDLSAWLGDQTVLPFPSVGRVPVEVLAATPDLEAQRLTALERLAGPEPVVVVATGEAALERLVPPGVLAAARMAVAVGDRLDRDAFLAGLVRAGYQHQDPVERRGQFVVRGGLIDVYPLTAASPVRIELEDEEVWSIRGFDPATQRSTAPLSYVTIFAARELLLDEVCAGQVVEAIRGELEMAEARLRAAGRGPAATRLRSRVEAHLEALVAGTEARRSYLPFAFPPVHLPDHLGPAGLVMVEEPARVAEHARRGEQLALEATARLLEEGALLPRETLTHAPAAELTRVLGRRQLVNFSLLPRSPDAGPAGPRINIRSRTLVGLGGRWNDFLTELGQWLDQGYVVCLAARDRSRADAMAAALADAAVPVSQDIPVPGRVVVAPAWLREGFELPEARLAVATEAEITGRPAPRRTLRAPPEGARIADYRELEPGDYVVHVNHGIGVFDGIQTLTVDGVARDYLFIRYAGTDRLYVPVDQIDMVHRYVGTEGHEPRVNRLGGTEWARTRRRVGQSVRKLAFDLVSLYARRQVLPGHACQPDGPWQADLEAAFPFEETPDQLRSIQEVKSDLERPHPMDRLLLGDVGYGKTEVAIRAAFKVVSEGRQVAVLVPTTVLAQQHFTTFSERLKGFPVEVRMLSRLRGQAEQADTLEGLRRGTVDIVIGTHRLLQDDVVFRDLGLLVVDEEHRFGVAHKERLKLLKEGVDVLTLSATPIPRTLHLALSGLRDTSFIGTPPEDRHPVQTYVCEYTDHLVREAVLREVARGGQVFYVHNRVKSIYRAAERLAGLLPGVRLVVAHGQMRETRLEEIFLQFVAGEHDVLVCTTIIEAGLDLPNVNTLIVEDADRLGLAQLYQLRGRVGRSDRLAYAYFTYRRGRVLTETAEKRLAALQEFTELGSGYRVALRDLELRGAGNILGPEQHGFMVAVGFDLYCQLLEEAVRELRGQKLPSRPEVQIELGIDAFIPESFIPDERQRLDVYRRLAGCRDVAGVEDVKRELEDRYGELPAPVHNLLAGVRLRELAILAGIGAIVQEGRRIRLRAAAARRPPDPAIARALKWGRGRVLPAPPRSNSLLVIRTEGMAKEALTDYLEALFREYLGPEGKECVH